VVLTRRNVLLLYAEQIVNERTAARNRDIAIRLLSESREAEEPNTRLRALWIAVRLFREYPDKALLAEISNQLEKETFGALSLEDQGEYALGKALCLYFSGNGARSLETIDDIIGDLEAHKIKNSVYLALLLGRCAIHGGLGEYEVAISIGERGVVVAGEMGEERRLRLFLANIALFNSRLGNPDAQLLWANRAAGNRWETNDPILDQNLHYVLAQGHALRGDLPEALDHIRRGNEALEQIHQPWVRQLWQLRAADVYAILGRNKEAQESARAAFMGELREIQSSFTAGPYARWSARLAVSNGDDVNETRMSLLALLRQGQQLDCIDQAEVLNAKVWFDSKTGTIDKEESDAMWEKLSKLPIGATNELRAMRMLDL
jgi:hypothetical protein